MKCEIYVTEGDSASGNLKLARDNEFVAVMPVRGKILNVRKASLDKIQKNAYSFIIIITPKETGESIEYKCYENKRIENRSRSLGK